MFSNCLLGNENISCGPRKNILNINKVWTKYVNIFEVQTDIEFHEFLTNCGKYKFFFS